MRYYLGYWNFWSVVIFLPLGLLMGFLINNYYIGFLVGGGLGLTLRYAIEREFQKKVFQEEKTGWQTIIITAVMFIILIIIFYFKFRAP